MNVIIKINILIVVLLSGLTYSATADTDKARMADSKQPWVTKEVPLNYAKQLTFHSKILDESMPINVYLPSSFYDVSDDYQYPVIFINGSHGNQFFHSLTGVVKHLSDLDRMPESIVVSLNYSGHFPTILTNNMGWRRESISGYGQPEKYLRHLKEELFPYLSKNYRANDHRTIIGISGSAIFPFYTAINQPNIFQNYLFLASMDVVGMKFDPNRTIIDDLKNTFAKQLETPTFVYMGVADNDIQKNHSKLYTENLAELKAALTPLINESFQFKQEVIKNERHYDALIKVMLSALDLMYPEAIWAPKYRELIAQPGDAMQNIDSYYAMLSNKVGFKVLPKAERWNSVNCLRFISRKLLDDGRVKESVSMAKRWLAFQPNSAAAHAQMSASYEADQQLVKAISASKKSVAIAKAKDDYRLADYEKQLAKLTKR